MKYLNIFYRFYRREKTKRRNEHVAKAMSSVVNARETRDECIRPWPQPVSKNLAFKYINILYHEATQLKTPPTCCVRARQKLDVEVYHMYFTERG